jgi:hypothetical protein
MFLSEWREFPSAPCHAGKKENLMTARISMLLKLRAFLTCLRTCFLPGRAKDLSATRYMPTGLGGRTFQLLPNYLKNVIAKAAICGCFSLEHLTRRFFPTLFRI